MGIAGLNGEKASVLLMTVPGVGVDAARLSIFREHGDYLGSQNAGATFAPDRFGGVKVIATQRRGPDPLTRLPYRKM